MFLHVPYALAPDIARCLPLQKGADLLYFATPRRSIVEEIAEFAGIGLHINGALDSSRIAFQDQDLVLRAALLLNSLHW